MKIDIEDVPEGQSRLERWAMGGYLSIISLSGILLFLFPRKGIFLGGFFLGLWLFIEGIRSIVAFIRHSLPWKDRNQLMRLIRGILTLVLGVVFVLRPGNTAELGLSLLFSFTGILFLFQAVLILLSGDREMTPASLLLGLIGLLLILSPLFTAFWFLRLIGFLILLRGGLGLYFLIKS